jgi:hypothetical protein
VQLARVLGLLVVVWSGLVLALALGIYATENQEPGERSRNVAVVAIAAGALAAAIALAVALYVGRWWLIAALGGIHVVLAAVGFALTADNGVAQVHAWVVALAVAGELAVLAAVVLARREPGGYQPT